MESALMTVPPSRRASEIARADLPLAVGPAMRTAETKSVLPDSGCPVEFYSVTLIAKPGSKALAGDIVNKAARIVPFGKVGPWLAADEAVDISFHLDGVDL